MSEEKEYSVKVWKLIYYLSDEDDNAKKDKDGRVILYTNPHDDLYSISDWADLADIEVDDLEVANVLPQFSIYFKGEQQ
tara:strand:+ start:52 stop:288 length:237 start_codon:yes stop_codon:yes gene_type:complete